MNEEIELKGKLRLIYLELSANRISLKEIAKQEKDIRDSNNLLLSEFVSGINKLRDKRYSYNKIGHEIMGLRPSRLTTQKVYQFMKINKKRK